MNLVAERVSSPVRTGIRRGAETCDAPKAKSPTNEFLRRYQPDQVRRFRDSYGLALDQAVTWFPFSHVGLF